MTWRVLLLDDNPRSAADLHEALCEVCADILLITDTRSLANPALFSSVSRDHFDAVVVSVALPGPSELDLFDRVYRDTRRRFIPIVLVGSDAGALARHEMSRTPADRYVRRPTNHDALVAELGAALLAVVGRGPRTISPPQYAEVGLLVASEVPHAPQGLADAGSSARPQPDAVGEGDAAAPPSPETNAAEVRGLEAELERCLELLKATERQLDVDRARHQEAIAAAAVDAELALAEERAMGQSALMSMGAELHAQSVRFGKTISDATARARDAEARARAADAALAEHRREVEQTQDGTPETAATTAAAGLLRDLEAERGRNHAREMEAQDQARAAQSARGTRERELVEALEKAAQQVSTLEQQLEQLEQRLQREIAMRRSNDEFALAAMRASEERIAALEAARASATEDDSSSESGEHLAPRRPAIPAEGLGAQPVARLPGFPRERRSGPPPFKSEARLTAHVPPSTDDETDDPRLPQRRAVLLIDADKGARVNIVRALARANCEVTVRDSCADLAVAIDGFDVIVNEVVGVAIEELVNLYGKRPRPDASIVVWTAGVEGARTLLDAAGLKDVSVLQKGHRADGLVAAVQSCLDDFASAAHG